MKSNYYSPTPKRWRIIGDVALLLIPVVSVAISEAPEMNDVVKYWLSQGCTIALVLVKFLTNFKHDAIN